VVVVVGWAFRSEGRLQGAGASLLFPMGVISKNGSRPS
jgi:hypothetical protein